MNNILTRSSVRTVAAILAMRAALNACVRFRGSLELTSPELVEPILEFPREWAAFDQAQDHNANKPRTSGLLAA